MHDPEKAALIARLQRAEAERDELLRVLHGLTPGGSEYANDAKACAEYVLHSRRSMFRNLKRYKAERDGQRVRAELAEENHEKCLRLIARLRADLADAEAARERVGALERVVEAARDVASAAVVFDDDRIAWVEAQVNREALTELRAALAALEYSEREPEDYRVEDAIDQSIYDRHFDDYGDVE